jgi:hypothetical protein
LCPTCTFPQSWPTFSSSSGKKLTYFPWDVHVQVASCIACAHPRTETTLPFPPLRCSSLSSFELPGLPGLGLPGLERVTDMDNKDFNEYAETCDLPSQMLFCEFYTNAMHLVPYAKYPHHPPACKPQPHKHICNCRHRHP